ncbi:MAG: hypothetical protein ACI8P9_003172 [Parasphingorhabdus sp.]|jgi:hypothetical protein
MAGRLAIVCSLIAALFSSISPIFAQQSTEPLRLLLPPSISQPDSTTLNEFTHALQRLTGRTVNLSFSDSSFVYLQAVERGEFDLAIANASISAWLIKANTVLPVVTEKQSQSFMTIVATSNESIYQLADLAGRKVCTPALPSLFLSHLTHTINNTHREPVGIASIDAEQRLRLLHSNQCKAIILTDKYYASLPSKESRRLRIVYQSPELPGYSFLIHEKHSKLLQTPLELWLLGPNTTRISAWLAGKPHQEARVWKPSAVKLLARYLDLSNGSSLPDIIN